MSAVPLTSRVLRSLDLPVPLVRGFALGAILGLLGVLLTRLTTPGRATGMAVVGLAARLTVAAGLLTAGVVADEQVDARAEARAAEPYPIAYELPRFFDRRTVRSTRDSYSVTSRDGRASFVSIAWTWEESPWPTLEAAAAELGRALGEDELRRCVLNGHRAWVYQSHWLRAADSTRVGRTYIALVHTPTHLHRLTAVLAPDPERLHASDLLEPLWYFDLPRGARFSLECEDDPPHAQVPS